MPVYRKPAVYDETLGCVREATCCERISPKYTETCTSSLVYEDARNSLRIVNHQLCVYTVSNREGNLLRSDEDGGAFFDANDVMSNASNNLLTISSVDNKIDLTKETLATAGFVNKFSDDLKSLISLDSGNALTVGSDGKLYLAR